MDRRGERPPNSSSIRHAILVEAVAVSPAVEGEVRLRLEDGGEQQLSVPEDLSDLFRPRLRVVLYQGADGELQGWYVPEHGIGCDLRS
jgi:hypothetical protein